MRTSILLLHSTAPDTRRVKLHTPPSSYCTSQVYFKSRSSNHFVINPTTYDRSHGSRPYIHTETSLLLIVSDVKSSYFITTNRQLLLPIFQMCTAHRVSSVVLICLSSASWHHFNNFSQDTPYIFRYSYQMEPYASPTASRRKCSLDGTSPVKVNTNLSYV